MKFSFLFLCFSLFSNITSCGDKHNAKPIYTPKVVDQNLSKAYFASGCFWCVEAVFESVIGVQEVVSGYCGGEADDANYDDVSSGSTDHAETIEVYYNPAFVSYETLLQVFFGSHDATTANRQGPDAGRQYRSAIFYSTEEEKIKANDYIQKLYESGEYESGSITTEVVPFKAFYAAEEYHQDYEKRNPNQPYIRGVSVPRLKKFQSKHPDLLKKEEKH